MKIRIIYNRKKVEGEAPVHVEVYFTRDDRVYLSTGINITEKQWDNQRQEVKNHKKSTTYNYQLKDLVKKVDSWERSLSRDGKFPTGNLLRSFMTTKGESKYFNDYFKDQLFQDEKRLATSTFKSHKSILKRFNEFGKIRLDDFNLAVINKYHMFLLKYMKESTTAKPHKVIRKYVIRAFNMGLMIDNPYRLFKLPRERSRTIHLTSDELQRLRQYEGIERLERVRDMFLFQCLTGMAYVDMQALKPSDILEHTNMRYIEKHRQKANRVPQLIPLLTEAEEILTRYQGQSHCFPKISNQKMNAYLAEIATIKEINKPLTSHVGRHTFATLMLEKGMPLEAVSNILGHASTKQTSVYAKILIGKIKNDLERLKIDKL